ncbi:MAG: histidinol-phosphate aminotransferase family protein [Fimbriimonadaceae bacterium]|nr:histidinol-phosphate aminotransferase family protein [Fimbriimonadaceae bacterium]
MDGPTHAIHGGASFDAIGSSFDDLDHRSEVIDADVLDAWYPPAPTVLADLQANLEWLIKTSPPTHGDGLRSVIGKHTGMSPESILVGGGTSSLMFLAFPRLVPIGDRVCLLDPMYGEYRHLVENVIGAEVVNADLDPSRDFLPDPVAVANAAEGCSLLVMVNPNSPTGQSLTHGEWEILLEHLDPHCRIWVDETYVDFVEDRPSVERYVGEDPRVIVCKSLSKFFGLSGLRIGYLAADPALVADWERFSPPWSVGLMGQVAAVRALEAMEYYKQRAHETRKFREDMILALDQINGIRCLPSVTNFILFELENGGAADLVADLRTQNIFLRDCTSLSRRFSDRYVRTAVKDQASNGRIIEAIKGSGALQLRGKH